MFRRLLTLGQLWRCRRVGPGVRVHGRIWIHGDGAIDIGRDVVFDGRLAPIELRTAKGGWLLIGDGVRIEGGVSLEAEGRLELRNGVHVEAYAKIIDNHFHPMVGDRNVRRPAGVVVVEEDAVIGSGAILLPGAHIGRGTQIGARAVVTKRVPPGVRISGNPGRVDGPAIPR